jgi:enoyl-CoA hydratase/3-hydroxyacyl-CoA dehydrogenase
MVIEAVIEDIGLKQRIFVDLEAHCPPHAILATNTSTINIELVGAKLKVGRQYRAVQHYNSTTLGWGWDSRV